MGENTSEKYFNKIAKDYDYYKNKNSFYNKKLKRLIGSLIPRNKKVFEIGCGTGDFLVLLKPKEGYGMDISNEMIKTAKIKYSKKSQIGFSTKWPSGNFDYIFMSDVIEHLENPEEVFYKISRMMNKDTFFVNTMANPILEPILIIAEKLGLKMPEGPHKRIGSRELEIMLERVDMKIIKHDFNLLMPIYIPFVTEFANKHLEKYFKRLAFIEYLVAVKA